MMRIVRLVLSSFTCLLSVIILPTTAFATCDPPCPGQICCSNGNCVSSVSNCVALTWEQPSSQIIGDRVELLMRGRLQEDSEFKANVLLTTRDPDMDVNGVFDCVSPKEAEIVCTDRLGELIFIVNYESLAPYLLTEDMRTGESFHFTLSRVSLMDRELPIPQ